MVYGFCQVHTASKTGNQVRRLNTSYQIQADVFGGTEDTQTFFNYVYHLQQTSVSHSVHRGGWVSLVPCPFRRGWIYTRGLCQRLGGYIWGWVDYVWGLGMSRVRYVWGSGYVWGTQSHPRNGSDGVGTNPLLLKPSAGHHMYSWQMSSIHPAEMHSCLCYI